MPDDRFDAPDWRDSRTCGACLIALYAALAALPAALVLGVNPSGGAPVFVRLGRVAALVGFTLLTLQVALTSRLRLLDRPFGLDRLTRFHRRMGIIACALLGAHPLFLAAGEGETWRFSFFPEWQVELGEIALSVLVAGVLLALFFGAVRMDYRIWRLLHKGMIAVVVLGFVHARLVGWDLHGVGMRVWFWTLLVVAAGIFLWRNVFVPLRVRRRFRVTSVTAETHDTFTLRLQAEDGRPLPHHPGQFVFPKLLRPGRTSEEHPFTISSAPTREGPLTVTVKESGDFTRTISRTRVGDAALVEGPFGRFSFVHHDAKQFLFIAGGVGITPVMSMLRTLRDLGDRRPAVLLYGNRTEADIIFRDELARMSRHVRVVHVLSGKTPTWTGPTGYVTAEFIREHAGDVLADAEVYLCGPPPMMTGVIRALRSLGVDRRRIHYERFAL